MSKRTINKNNEGRQKLNDTRKKRTSNSKTSSSSSSFSWGAKVHTLSTINDFSKATSYNSNTILGAGSNFASSSSSSSLSFTIQHIPNLPLSSQAQQMLQRIQNEFQPIIRRRGYNITSVTEMCCCDDGFNYLYNGGSNNNNANNNATKRKRKIKNMPNNILGYNLTSGTRNRNHGSKNQSTNSTHRIHLRLRRPSNHASSFYPYEDIAGTMCHELAHCEISKHNANFYRLMDEIMDQYQLSLINGGFVLDKNGFPMNSDQAYVLGGGCNTKSQNGEAGNAAILRWEQRKKFGFGGTYVLGTAYSKDNTTTLSTQLSLANLPPNEAARIAAERRIEARRRNDSKYCLPCQDIIEILDDSSSDDDEDVAYAHKNNESADRKTHTLGEHNSKKINIPDMFVIDDDNKYTKFMSQHTKKRIDNTKTHPKQDALEIIDLTDDIHNGTQQSVSNTRKGSNENVKIKMKQSHSNRLSNKSEKDWTTYWSCIKCTYAENREVTVSCNICGSERHSTYFDTQKEIDKIIRQDFFDDVKRMELEQSKKDFNGFNIYGHTKQSSSTMNHFT